MKKILAACLLLCALLGACKAEQEPAVFLFADRDGGNFTHGYLFDLNGDGTPEFCSDVVSSYEGYVLQWVVVVDYANGKKYTLCDDLSQVDETHGPVRYYLKTDPENGELYVAKRAYNAEVRDYEKVALSIEGLEEMEE